VRRILLNLAENADLFGGDVPAKLREPWYLTTPDIAAMDEDRSLTLSVVRERLISVFGLSPSHCPFSTRRQVPPSSPALLLLCPYCPGHGRQFMGLLILSA
jgi:hypothetical protein